jgi:hypothetical protein
VRIGSGILFLLGAIALTSLVRVAPADDSPPSSADPAGIQFFETKIRPLLAGNCYKCHSAQAASAKKLKGGLYLDTREGVLKGGDNGPAIVPGKPADSRLMTAVRWVDEDLKMPPKTRLSESAVADLEKWVAMGAPDPRTGSPPPTTMATGPDIEAGKKFWSFRPLSPAPAPAVKNEAWARTPIDRFILAKLEEKNLAPNGPAPRATLIRRAYFDLVGLPPTPEAVDAFVNDNSPDAWDKVIDSLLASPAYGERWARHWLDVTRFAESDGYEFDADRPSAWPYRDFVIRALNEDMPFDQFARWQIAGDEIAPSDSQALAATGFLTAGVFPTQITEREFESTRYDQLDDMVSTTGVAFLGMTVGCARCHDHKFDPIGTQDYYRFAASFATAVPCEIEADESTPAERKKHQAEWEGRLAELRDKATALERGVVAKRFEDLLVASVRKDPAAPQSAWSVLRFDEVKTANGTKLEPQPDGSLLKTGATPVKETYTLTARTAESSVSALRLEALADKSLPHDGPGAGDNGNFALTEIEVLAAPAGNPSKSSRVKIASASATFEQNKTSLSVASSFDGKSNTGWAVDGGGIGKTQAAIFRFAQPAGLPGGTLLTITLHFDHPSPRHLIGRPRLSVTSLPNPKDFAGAEGPAPDIARTLAALAAGKDVPPGEAEAARQWFASTVPEYAQLKQEIAKLEWAGPQKTLVKMRVTSEGLPPIKCNADERGYPHFYQQVYLLRRGDPNNKMEPVSESFPRVLMRGRPESYWQTSPPAGAHTSYRRTALANWLTDPQFGGGQLAARVIVNRVWQHHFGSGLVATPNDFGAQGDRPTHPELLDWLASDLIEHGWTLKRLHKLMMTSSAYMESADTSPDRVAADPHDQLLWRWEPRRLEAEPIRDSMLSVAGLLDPKMYGPGTLDENSRRRSIYFAVKRSRLIPMLMVLDWPEPLNSIGARPVTTVAPQALLFLNSPQARAYAQALADRVKSPQTSESIENGYRLALQRKPTPVEVAAAEAFIQSQARGYREAGQREPEASALVDFCQALLSTNEFVYVE